MVDVEGARHRSGISAWSGEEGNMVGWQTPDTAEDVLMLPVPSSAEGEKELLVVSSGREGVALALAVTMEEMVLKSGGRFSQFPRRLDRQLWHIEPAFTQAQFIHLPVLLHRQQFLTGWAAMIPDWAWLPRVYSLQ